MRRPPKLLVWAAGLVGVVALSPGDRHGHGAYWRAATRQTKPGMMTRHRLAAIRMPSNPGGTELPRMCTAPGTASPLRVAQIEPSVRGLHASPASAPVT